MKKWKRMAAIVTAAALFVTGLPAWEMPVQAHGTTDVTITESMLNKTPPEDYQVNMDMQKNASEGAYCAYFLEDEIQTVSISIDENNLNYLFQNALDEPSVMTNSVTIGDQTIGYTGLKTKGNYTLEHTFTDNPDSDRFSFTINFGKFIKKKKYGVKQNFYGCSKISFNNFFFDKTMMREFFAMKLMTEMGLPTPAYGLAKLYINGSYYGVYFMVEAMDSSILERHYQVASDAVSDYLTKPTGSTLTYDTALDALLDDAGNFDLSTVLTENDEGDYETSGALSDQSYLWENDADTLQDVADMLPTVLTWQKKLTQLSRGTDFSGNTLDVNSEEYLTLLESVMDVDEVVRYFAVHSFLVQMDNMFTEKQNFGLYVDETGKSKIIPWDYDLCFGCYYPSTAELTANYDIDTMYKKNLSFGWGNRPQADTFTYSDYPIFHVIYQNKALMEKYHTYMKECAKVAALGGTVSSGKTYEPGWFYSYIEQFTSKLGIAASEKLASNVTYLNGAVQPANMYLALPNLSKIIAMRSVAVLSQAEGRSTTVCGYGCDLSTLGNASQGESSNSGALTIVDAATGIHVSADYGKKDRAKVSPQLTVKKLTMTDETYQKVKTKLNCMSDDSLTVYKMTDRAVPTTKYTVCLPLDSSYKDSSVALYSYTENRTRKLNTTVSDNMISGLANSIQYIAVVRTEQETALADIELESASTAVEKETTPSQTPTVTIAPTSSALPSALPVPSAAAAQETPVPEETVGDTDEEEVVTTPPKSKKICLNKKKLTLKKGKSFQLKLKHAVKKKVTWKSSNKKVAAVTKIGKVKAKRKGTAVIRAVYKKKKYKCRVTVKR